MDSFKNLLDLFISLYFLIKLYYQKNIAMKKASKKSHWKNNQKKLLNVLAAFSNGLSQSMPIAGLLHNLVLAIWYEYKS